jgi:hypothetical protein
MLKFTTRRGRNIKKDCDTASIEENLRKKAGFPIKPGMTEAKKVGGSGIKFNSHSPLEEVLFDVHFEFCQTQSNIEPSPLY